jgi:hypothetical protein
MPMSYERSTFWVLITLKISDGTLNCLRTRALPKRQEGLWRRGSQGRWSLTFLVRLALKRSSYHRPSKTLRGLFDDFPDGREHGYDSGGSGGSCDSYDEAEDMLAVYPH